MVPKQSQTVSPASMSRARARPFALVPLAVATAGGAILLASAWPGVGSSVDGWHDIVVVALLVLVVIAATAMGIYEVLHGRGIWYAPGLRREIQVAGPGSERVCDLVVGPFTGVEVRVARVEGADTSCVFRVLLQDDVKGQNWSSAKLDNSQENKPIYVTLLPSCFLKRASVFVAVDETSSSGPVFIDVRVYHVFGRSRCPVHVHGGIEGQSHTAAGTG